MQTTLNNFYSEYGIRNGQAPNETVLNRGLLRLKREIREIYSILQIIQGKPIEEWNPDKIFEQLNGFKLRLKQKKTVKI